MIPVEAGGAEYFKTMDIPILRGRGFLASDDEKAPNVAVVSKRTALMLWGDEDPIGRRIRSAGDTSANAWRTVVGIAGDIRYRVLRETTPTVYLPSPQYFFQGLIILRSALPLAQLMPQIRETVRQTSPDARIADALTMDDLLATQRAVPRLSSTLISALGATALLLSAIGLFGILSALVRERTREIAVRAALGATPARLRGDVLRESLRVTVAGAAVGLAGALGASRLVASVLYEVSPADPLALGGACAVLLAVAVLATLLPAERVTRIDPATALRS